ncbi:hypothetical protein PoB_007618100 [Plakobranchus ocellatus]|uniref:Uncharacterized protein n=1 Tax=Plakobranchus ocellatus TaxID=259542 RepID=A0AAV4E0Q3_9GAST|nr:hypothetical protein PoB_007618100 [Plakobranchus ocellatus]
MCYRQNPSTRKVPEISEPFGATGTYMPENKMDHEHEDLASVTKRTIKATVQNVQTPKTFYISYFYKVAGKNSFDENNLFLDCLNKKLYVTFHDEKDANGVFMMNHGPDSNLERLEKATAADFNIFVDRVSVHGFCMKNSLARDKFFDFIVTKTQMGIKDFFIQDEPRSAIIIFEDDFYFEIFWKLMTVYLGTKIMAAPVYKTKTVSISNLPAEVDKKLLYKCLKICRIGGGDIESLEMCDGQAKITFKSEEQYRPQVPKLYKCSSSNNGNRKDNNNNNRSNYNSNNYSSNKDDDEQQQQPRTTSTMKATWQKKICCWPS